MGREFSIIERYFKRLTQDRVEAGGLADDAAILSVPEGEELVVSSDTLNAGVHFPIDAAAGDIAHRALRVNLSDLAAMGAQPLAYQLNIAFPEPPEEVWLEEFTQSLLADQIAFDIFCSGGDTTRTQGPLSLSITVMGTVPKGKAIRRSGAQAGDVIMVTGCIGDAYLALSHSDEYFQARFYTPSPRLDLCRPMRRHAHAAIDISDGLIADIEHICEASGLQARINLSNIPLSDPARAVIGRGEVDVMDLLSGGDDYELVLAVPEAAVDYFSDAHTIGYFTQGHGVILSGEDGEDVKLKKSGWQHF